MANMKTIGVVGITAEGASDCYKKIVKLAGERLGSNRHPEIVIVNPSFDTIVAAQKRQDWSTVAEIIASAGQKCINAGAELIIIPANSVHFAYEDVANKLDVPVVSIVDTVVNACSAQKLKKVAVLGVGITMSEGLYDNALRQNGIGQVKLNEGAIKELDSIIYNELVNGIINQESVKRILSICSQLQAEGCEALVLACTELQMVLNNNNAPLPVLDSTELLAVRAVELSLE